MMLYLLFKGTPIEYGHIFLMPCGFKSLPQFLDARSLEMIIRMAIEVNNCSFRVFFDNIMPGASHPYFQVWNCFSFFPQITSLDINIVANVVIANVFLTCLEVYVDAISNIRKSNSLLVLLYVGGSLLS